MLDTDILAYEAAHDQAQEKILQMVLVFRYDV